MRDFGSDVRCSLGGWVEGAQRCVDRRFDAESSMGVFGTVGKIERATTNQGGGKPVVVGTVWYAERR